VLWCLPVTGFNLLPSLAYSHIILLSSEACICPLDTALPAVWPQCTCYGRHVSVLIILNGSAHHWNTNLSRALLTRQPMDRTVIIGLSGVIQYTNTILPTLPLTSQNTDRRLKIINNFVPLYLFICLFIYFYTSNYIMKMSVGLLCTFHLILCGWLNKTETGRSNGEDQKCVHRLVPGSLTFWKMNLIWDLRPSMILRRAEWLFYTDVRGQPVRPIFKGAEVQILPLYPALYPRSAQKPPTLTRKPEIRHKITLYCIQRVSSCLSEHCACTSRVSRWQLCSQITVHS
jgi:branched-subunit amino acid transport protein AzlD